MAEKGQKNTHTHKYNLRTCRHILPSWCTMWGKSKEFCFNKRMGARNKMQARSL